MTKQEMIVELANNHALTREKAATILADITEINLDNLLLNGGEATIYGIGKLKVVDRAERKGRNPKTGETIRIAPTRVVKFTATKDLKVALNQ